MQKKRGGKIPSVPSSIPAQQSNHRVPGPGPTIKLVGTMVQDSGKKREKPCIKKKKNMYQKKERAMYQRVKQIHILLKETRSSLETQT